MRYHIESSGNGASYTLRRLSDGATLFLQGDDASRLSAELEATNGWNKDDDVVAEYDHLFVACKNSARDAAILQHGENLLKLFKKATEVDPVELCRKLRRLEAKANAIALRLCNGPEFSDEDECDQQCDAVLAKVDVLLGFSKSQIPVFINRDPRGYALKIRDTWMREHSTALHRDLGGYGILAPDLS